MDVHVGRHAGEIFEKAAHWHLAGSPLTFERLHLDHLANAHAEDLTELFGHHDAFLRHDDAAPLIIEHAIEFRITRHAGDGEFSRVMAVPQAGLHGADRLRPLHAGQMLKVVKGAPAAWLRQKHHRILPLHIIPLISQ